MIQYDVVKAENILNRYLQEYLDDDIENIALYGVAYGVEFQKYNEHASVYDIQLLELHAAMKYFNINNYFSYTALGDRLTFATRYGDAISVLEKINKPNCFYNFYENAGIRIAILYFLQHNSQRAIVSLIKMVETHKEEIDKDTLKILNGLLAIFYLGADDADNGHALYSKSIMPVLGISLTDISNKSIKELILFIPTYFYAIHSLDVEYGNIATFFDIIVSLDRFGLL